MFLEALPAYAEEVLIAIVPIVVVFLIFQLITRRFQAPSAGQNGHRHRLCLCGAGHVSDRRERGLHALRSDDRRRLAGSAVPWILVLVGMVVGYFIVRAEPAVQILTRQVEEVSNGSVTQKAMMNAPEHRRGHFRGPCHAAHPDGPAHHGPDDPRLHRGPGPHLPGAPAVHQHRLRLRRRGLRPHDHHVPAAPWPRAPAAPWAAIC